MSCPACDCTAIGGIHVHALIAALREADLDRAIELGLLDDTVACSGCSEECRTLLQAARVQRQRALAARERFRARNARLERRQRERAERRKPPAAATANTALPAAAAAALARAKARAAGCKDG